MLYCGKSFVEHTAIYVKDILWHIRFFEEVFGMTVLHLEGTHKLPRKVWLSGGIQINEDKGFYAQEGRLAHLGITTDDLSLCLEAAYERGVTTMSNGQGKNWIRLPDGLCIEVLQAKENATDVYLTNQPSLSNLPCFMQEGSI